MHNKVISVVGFLQDKVDPMVSVMTVEKAPVESYADIGGLDAQTQEIKEAVELPLTHPELYEDIRIRESFYMGNQEQERLCLPRLLQVAKKLECMQSVKIDKISSSLPDDILVEILIRVPVQTVLQCRRVCKHLRTLTSTPDFIHNHFLKQQSTPSIVIAYRSKHRPLYKEPNEILYINDWGSTASGSSSSLLGEVLKQQNMNLNNTLRLETVLVNYGQWPSYFRLASYCNNGVLLFSKLPSVAPFEVKSYVICNPVTQEKVELNINEGDICACFYHPLAKEYRLIWGRGRMEESNNWMFKIINLGGKVFSHTIFAHRPSWDCSPPVVLTNQNAGLLHWMIADTMQQSLGHQQPCCEESIIVFNVSTETFSAMPHPGDKCARKKSRHRRMRLLELKKTELSGTSESLLCLCDCTVPGVTEMWVLEDYEKGVWMRRHKIIVAYGLPLPLGLINGELLFHDSYVKGVLAYDIDNKTMRKINYGIHPDISDIAYVSLHPMSLVSFTKLICIARYNLSFLE